MSDEIRVDTVKLRGVSRDLDAVAARVEGVLATLRSTLSNCGPAVWGDDEAGRQFGEVFAPQAGNAVSTCQSLVDGPRQYSGIFLHAAKLLDDTEHRSAQGFTTGA